MVRILLLSIGVLMLAATVAAQDFYQVVWDSPSKDSSGSMPLGNGDIGINAWAEENGDVLFYIGKTDAWSAHVRLLKLGRIRLSTAPNILAGTPWSQTLDTRRGLLEIKAGEASLRIWVDANYPAIRVEAAAPAPFTMTAALEPWRTHPRELLPEERDSAYGMAESPGPIVEEADILPGAPESPIVWFHRNNTSIWPDTLQLQGMNDWISSGKDPLINRSFGGCMQGAGFAAKDNLTLQSAEPAPAQRLAIYALTRQTASPGEWVEAIKRLAAEDASGWETAWQRHVDWWRDFWNRSWIHLLGKGLDDLNRGYALQRFITACAGRGGSPVKFNGSIFTVDAEVNGKRLDADYRRWGGPYWFQNTRLVYWPMLAAGDFDMMAPLFKMYLDALPFAEARTQTYFQHGGAFFPETMYFWGAYANDNYGWNREGKTLGVTDNAYIRYYYDGALELLALMLDHYRYAQNADFMRNTLLPLAQPVLTFYRQHYALGADEKLRIEPSQALETWQKAINPLPPIAGLHCVLNGLLELPQELTTEDQRAFWLAFQKVLPDLPRGKGPVLAAAGEILEEARNSENPELYAVFPYHLFGMDRPELDMARRTFEQRRVKGNEGWRQDDTQAALLGLTEEAAERLSKRLANKNEGSRFPAFWGPNFDWIPDQDHGGNAMMALQNMLLQTNGRKILLFPAWPKSWDVEFRLNAPWNTVVEARYKNGNLENLTVTPPKRRQDVVLMNAPAL